MTNIESKQISVADRLRALASNQTALLIFVLVILTTYFTIFSNGLFITPQSEAVVLTQWGYVVPLAVGEALVIISGGIDLSIGATASVATVLAAFVMREVMHGAIDVKGSAAWPFLLVGLVVAVATGLLVGFINALLINYVKIVPFIATLSTMGAGLGAAVVISGGLPITGPNDYTLVTAIQLGDTKMPFSILAVVMLLVVTVVGLFLHKSRFGLHVFSIGSNPFATRAAGINVNLQITKIYMISGGLAGLAGMYEYIQLSTGSPTAGQGLELDAIAAVVIGGVALTGGVGRISGVILGTLMLYTIQTGLIMVGIDANWKRIVVAILIALAVGVQGLRKNNGRK